VLGERGTGWSIVGRGDSDCYVNSFDETPPLTFERMKKYCLLLLCMAILGIVHGQSFKPEKVSLKYMGIRFEIPKDWRYDSYGSSSVCDCEGVILDNLDRELRINVYTTDAEGMKEPMRNSIWDYGWDVAAAKPFTYSGASVVKYVGEIGQWVDKADDHVVIRLDAHLGKQYARIFIFGPEEDMKTDEAV
jgi:hypothetical protein